MRTTLASLCALLLTLAACWSSSSDSPEDASPAPADVADASDVTPDALDAGSVDAGQGDAVADTGCPPGADPLPRGGCACRYGRRLCDGACLDVTGDRMNCGACGVVCGPGRRCEASTCVFPTCTPPLVACNATCLDVMGNDAMNCGGCHDVCLRPKAHNLVGSCAAGVCEFHCAAGWRDCNLNSTDGCETANGEDAGPQRCRVL